MLERLGDGYPSGGVEAQHVREQVQRRLGRPGILVPKVQGGLIREPGEVLANLALPTERENKRRAVRRPERGEAGKRIDSFHGC